LVTHYPLRTAKGKLERGTHRLRDHAAALECAKACGINLWLHGHIHTPYVLEPSIEIPFPVICAGSATQTGKWSYTDITIDGHTITATHRRYDAALDQFKDSTRNHFPIKVSA
jgi:hypothetical protein